MGGLLTIVEFSTELVVGAPLDHLSHMLSFFVDRHCPNDRPLGWAGQDFDLDGTCFSDLAVQLFEVCGVLERTEQKGGSVKSQYKVLCISCSKTNAIKLSKAERMWPRAQWNTCSVTAVYLNNSHKLLKRRVASGYFCLLPQAEGAQI